MRTRIDPIMSALAVTFLVLVVAIILIADAGLGLRAFPWLYETPGLDKLGHFGLMGAMAYLLNRSVHGVGVKVTAALLLLVTLEEASQYLLSYRNFDLGDLACDYVGIATFAWLAVIISRHETHKH